MGTKTKKKKQISGPQAVVLAHPTLPNTFALGLEDGTVLEGYGYVNAHPYTSKKPAGQIKPEDRTKGGDCTTCGFKADHPSHDPEIAKSASANDAEE